MYIIPIFMGGRPYADTGNRAADFIVTKQERLPAGQARYAMVKSDIRAGKIFLGRKPQAFALWLFDLLGLRPEDEFVDLFPGSGAISRAYGCWSAQGMSTRSAETEGLSPQDASPVRDSECAQGPDMLEWRE